MRLPAPFHADGEHVAIELPGGRALFTTRRGGVSRGPYRSLNLGLTVPGAEGRPVPGDAPEAVAANRRTVAAQVEMAPERFAQGHQVHGRTVARVTTAPDAFWGAARLGAAPADGQATPLPDVAVVVLVADCLPIALIAPGAVAMIHAGWRGLAAGVLQEGVAALRELGAEGQISAAIGPGAGGCCYEVGEEVHTAFAAFGPDVRDGRRLDLKRIAERSLHAAGVHDVHDAALCTLCADPALFFSHRRDGGVTGRQAGVAWRS
jgi:YfiH family protein